MTLATINAERFVETFEAKEIDQIARDRKSAELANKFARLGRILISIRELPKILFKLSAGESLVINSDGTMYTGRIGEEKLQKKFRKLPERISFIRHDYLPPASDSKLYVALPRQSHVDSWDRLLKIPTEKNGVIAGIFRYKFETAKEGDIQKEIVEISGGNTYVVVTIKGTKFQGIFNTGTGTLRSVIYDGKRYEVYHREYLKKVTVEIKE